jgi:hypothetical protein
MYRDWIRIHRRTLDVYETQVFYMHLVRIGEGGEGPGDRGGVIRCESGSVVSAHRHWCKYGI